MRRSLTAAINEAVGQGQEDHRWRQFSCDFTKENFAAKPDLSAPGADEVS